VRFQRLAATFPAQYPVQWTAQQARGARPRTKAGTRLRPTIGWGKARAHANISITLDEYGHLMPGNEDEAAELLECLS